MAKTLANLYIHAITNDRLPQGFYKTIFRPVNPLSEDELGAKKKELVSNLSEKPKRTIGTMHKYCILTQDQLEQFCSDKFSVYTSFVVFGCPSSTDIDVVCFVNQIYISDGQPFPLFSTELDRLKKELVVAGYDIVNREIDLNLVCLDRFGHIVACSKGGFEITNIILATHHLHKQQANFVLPKIEFVKSFTLNKLRTIAKFILDHLEDIAIDYKFIRPYKIEVYQDGCDKMLDFTKNIFTCIRTLNPETETVQWRNFMKSLTMKYIQLILAQINEYEYTKLGLADKICSYFGTLSKENMLWLLFRGKRGTMTDTWLTDLLFLHQRYVEIINHYFADMETNAKYIRINHSDLLTSNPTVIPDSLFHKFLESPCIATREFEDEFVSLKYSEINSLFPLQSTSAELRPVFGNPLIDSKFIWINQRDPEWLRLLTFYTCGTNSANIGDSFQSKYNLLRGSIAEMLVMKLFQPASVGLHGFDKCFVGLIVEQEGVKGALGCAPDMLLVSPNRKEIIPVEIKCLHSDKHNSDYYRGLELAQKQCQRVKDILDKNNDFNLISRGLIILSWFNPDDKSFVLNCLQVSIC